MFSWPHLGGVQISGVFHGSGVVAVVPVDDHRIKQVGEHLWGKEHEVEERRS